jgi:hypothetical protein
MEKAPSVAMIISGAATGGIAACFSCASRSAMSAGGEAVALGLAQPHAVDDRGVV